MGFLHSRIHMYGDTAPAQCRTAPPCHPRFPPQPPLRPTHNLVVHRHLHQQRLELLVACEQQQLLGIREAEEAAWTQLLRDRDDALSKVAPAESQGVLLRWAGGGGGVLEEKGPPSLFEVPCR